MNEKRNLFRELNIIKHTDNAKTPLDIDISKVKDMVNNKIKSDSSYSERTINIMKSKKKFTLIAAAAVLVLGITAFAASGIITSWNSSSSSNPEYKALPTAQQCIKDIGYSPVLINTFANGYTFKDGSIVKNDFKDDGGNSVEKFKSVTFTYDNNGDNVIVSQDKFNSEIDTQGSIISTEKGIDIYYSSYKNKCVAGDYKMTDEDKRAEAAGELVFSYGVEKSEIDTVQGVTFTKDSIHYNMMQINGKLTPDNLVDMAKEIINK